MKMSLAEFDLSFLAEAPAVIGVDEAGRGPLAGPVCAAAVCLDRGFFESGWYRDFGALVNDSKQVPESVRENLYDAILETGDGLIHHACHMATVAEIEALNILGATRAAMERCINHLLDDAHCPAMEICEGADSLFRFASGEARARVLVDGRPLKPFPHVHTAIVKGDGKSMSIALASIIAKVTRDRHMREQAALYPEYGFTTNKGYGTRAHIAALKSSGPCKLHRMSFLTQILSA